MEGGIGRKMKKIGSLILAPVIVGIIITVFSFYINNEKVDIKYSLSSSDMLCHLSMTKQNLI